jgi:SAM-dependent methyltransferase
VSWQPSAAEFDQISEVYDATREPLEEELVDRIAARLEAWKIRSLLEIGIGTGRVAVPLAAKGFDVTGVDASKGMLRRAREKGVARLVRGSAYHLPFADASLDGALFVHVLHILDRPSQALGEACRASRRGAAALVRPAGRESPTDKDRLRPRRLVVERLRQDGVDLPDRAAGGPPVAERRILESYPPDRLETIREDDVTEPLARELEMFEKRASRWTLRVPPEKMARAVAAVRAVVGDQVRTYHRVLSLALWERAPRRTEPWPAPGSEALPGVDSTPPSTGPT